MDKKCKSDADRVIPWIEICLAIGITLWGGTSYYIKNEIQANRAVTTEKMHEIELKLTSVDSKVEQIVNMQNAITLLEAEVDELRIRVALNTKEGRNGTSSIKGAN